MKARFAPSFLGIIHLNFRFVVLVIASPGLKRVSRETISSWTAQLCDLDDMAQCHNGETLPIGNVDRSKVISKRFRSEDLGKMSGNSLESGRHGGHRTEDDPVTLACEDKSQGLSCNEPTNEGPNSSWTEYRSPNSPVNVGALDQFTQDQLPEELRFTFSNLYELEAFLGSSIVPDPDNPQSTNEGAGADGGFPMTQRQEQHLQNGDPYSNWLPGIHPLELPAINQGAQNDPNQFFCGIGKDKQQETYNCFFNDPVNCVPSPSFYSDHHTQTRTMQPQVKLNNPDHSESFQVPYSPQPSRSHLNTHCAKDKLFNLQKEVSIFCPTLPLLDVRCQKVGMEYKKGPPQSSISASALEKYVLPFKATVNRVLSSSRQKNQTTKRFKGITAVEVNHCNLPVPQIRALKESQHNLLSPSQLINLLEPLLKWFLFSHEAFLQKISISEQERPVFHQKFLDWLEIELFRPHGSLPIAGPVRTKVVRYDESDFGIVQKKIFEYLFPRNASQAACKMSIAIIGIWYRNSILKDWWDSPDGGDERFWEIMNQSISLAIESNITVHHPSEPSDNSLEEVLGNFMTFDLPTDFCARKFKLNSHRLIDSDSTCPIEKEIMGQIELIHKNIQTGWLIKNLVGCPAAFLAARIQNGASFDLNVVRVLDPLDRTISPTKTNRKFSVLIKKMEVFFAILKNSVDSGRARGNFGTKAELLEWLKRRCFSFDAGFPIFGVFDKGIEIKNRHSLGEFQLYIIDYISKKSERLHGDKSAIAVLGYWCKTEFSEFWTDNWETDQEYWEFMFDELLQYPAFTADE